MAVAVLASSGVQYTDRRDFYPTPYEMAKLYPAVTPFLSILYANFSKASGMLKDPTYKMFEYRAGWRYQYLDVNDGAPGAWSNPGAGVGTPGATREVDVDTATGITVDSSLLGTLVDIWDSTLTTHKGVARVHAVTSSTNITLKVVENPGSSTEAATALADNDRLFVIDTAYGEKAESPDASSDELEVVYNSIYKSRTPLQLSKDLAESTLRGARDERMRLRDTKGNEHKIRTNRGLYFSARNGGMGGTAWGADSTGATSDSFSDTHITDADSDTVRTTMGLFSALTRYGRASDTDDQQNVFNVSEGAFHWNDFINMSEKAFQYSPLGGEKLLFCGPPALSFWNRVGAEGLLTARTGARMKVTLSGTERSERLGLNFKYLETPHGVFKVFRDEILRNTPYKKYCTWVDESLVSLCMWKRDEFKADIKKDNNPDYYKDEFRSYVGLRLTVMEAHGQLRLV